MSLQDEIRTKKKEIVVDAYPMSIGEMINLYKDGEMDIHPEFQRFFRWDEKQRSNLIESILLGIPIPPIFVAQKQSGKWDVIDGQQRLGSILQFVHSLKNDEGELTDPLILRKSKFLPSFENTSWDGPEKNFSESEKITFKREKINFTIIKESDDRDDVKYELFQRLNTGGTHLSPQEIRNCLLIMINKSFYEKVVVMGNNKNYITCIPITDQQLEERQELEFVIRYLVYNKLNTANVDSSNNMDSFLTDEIEKLSKSSEYDIEKDVQRFLDIFALLANTLGENSFKRYKTDKFVGPVLVSAFEAIIPGLYSNFDYWKDKVGVLETKIKDTYDQLEYQNATRRGIRPIDRMISLVDFSRRWFGNEN